MFSKEKKKDLYSIYENTKKVYEKLKENDSKYMSIFKKYEESLKVSEKDKNGINKITKQLLNFWDCLKKQEMINFNDEISRMIKRLKHIDSIDSNLFSKEVKDLINNF